MGHITCSFQILYHHFGFEREGSPQFLKDFGKNNGVSVDIVEPISDNKVTISSTNIRKLVQNGYVRRASFELGWVFGFEANVIHGAGRGRTLGFPTANFIPKEKKSTCSCPRCLLYSWKD